MIARSSGGAGKIGPLLATFLVAGNMIGSGIYLLPASLGAFGSISILGWIGATLVALLLGGMFATFATVRPEGETIIDAIAAAFGPLSAFVAAAIYWVQGLMGNVAIALAVTGYLAALFGGQAGQIAIAGCTISVIWLMLLMNLVGPRLVARLEGATLAFGLLPVLFAATIGWFYFDPEIFRASWNVSGQPAASVVPQAIILILWAFLGLESAAVASAMVVNPGRNVPIATLSGVVLAAAVYIAASTALMGIISASGLAASSAPFADAATVMLGVSAGAVVALCAAFKASGTLAGWILLTAESARLAHAVDAPGDRSVRPGRLNFLLSGLLMTLMVLLTIDASIAAQFTRLINAVVILMVCFYGIAGAALARLGRSWPAILLGSAGVLLALVILALQDRFTLTCVAATIVATIIARYVVRGFVQSRRA